MQALTEGDSQPSAAYTPNLVVNVSARHVHLTREHLGRLFGAAESF